LGLSRSENALLERSAASLTGVGDKLMQRLMRLGVESIGDLLCLLPQRYEDRTEIRPLGSLRPGDRVLVEGEIALSEVAFRRRRSLLCRLTDGTGAITLRFFHFSRQQQAGLERGARLRCFGDVRPGPTGLEMIHPEYQLIGSEQTAPANTLTPIYPSTEGLQQARIRRLVGQALAALEQQAMADYLADLLDPEWPSLDAALKLLHVPPRGSDVEQLVERRHPCQRRIALEELVAHRLSLRRTAAQASRDRALPLTASDVASERFCSQLPFELTTGQLRAAAEIIEDLRRPVPMLRLLQGDVGSGKTVVAALAMYLATVEGHQAALMAPTEILAEQHAASFAGWFGPLGIGVALLTGSLPAAKRRLALEAVASGQAPIVIGTHALFQEQVSFSRLALVAVDEQHRFGVQQRLSLRQKGSAGTVPHQLVMTATPIPRTLAMTAYADLDCSIIDVLPAGRQPVTTVVLPESRRPELVARVASHCREGAQAYWVCPLIEESDQVDTQAAEALGRELAEALPELRLGLVHGRMKAADKDAVMRRFKGGEIDLLVATTVIEVGVDVPRATLMIIENAERMGLAQLHQLRGRVGRGSERSSCVLFYKPPLSRTARERLGVMRETTDGFVIAQKDLELRGPGEVLGTRQTGLQQLRVADLAADADLLPLVVEISDRIEAGHPDRVAPLIRRWIKSGVEYAKV
jgi:ATP-dependent DNA helicase RecG